MQNTGNQQQCIYSSFYSPGGGGPGGHGPDDTPRMQCEAREMVLVAIGTVVDFQVLQAVGGVHISQRLVLHQLARHWHHDGVVRLLRGKRRR